MMRFIKRNIASLMKIKMKDKKKILLSNLYLSEMPVSQTAQALILAIKSNIAGWDILKAFDVPISRSPEYSFGRSRVAKMIFSPDKTEI